MAALTQYVAARGFVGLAPEAAPGTAAAATSYVPLLDESLAHEPGIVLEKLLRGSRDTAFTPVVGEQKITGAISTPLYVDQGMALLAAAIGSDVYQYATGASGFVARGASGGGPGDGFIAVNTVPAGVSAGGFVQLQQSSANPSVTNLSEIHQVAAISGSGPYTLTFTSGEKLHAGYGAAADIANAGNGPYTHVLQPDQPNAGAYKTLTVEKNLGGLASLQFAGAVVGKAALKLTSKEAAKVSYTVSALAEAQITPSMPSYGTSAPLALPNFAPSLFGASDSSLISFNLDIDQTAKEYWTFNGANLPAMVTPVERKITGKFSNVAQSLAYYNDMLVGATGQAALTLTQGANSVVFTLPRIVLTKLGLPLKVADLLLYDAEFQATYADTAGYSIAVTVTNGAWAPLI